MAGRMFYERGYPGTTLKDVTDVLGLTAPAIYRHFSSKHALLFAVLDTALDSVEARLTEHAELTVHQTIRALVEAAVERPDVWELTERNARHLEEEERELIASRMRSIGRRLRAAISRARPDLHDDQTVFLSRALLALFTMPSAYAGKMPSDELIGIMVAASERALAVDADVLTPPTLLDAPDLRLIDPTSKREHLLREAARLFSERGYEDVSMTDIGVAVGMSGPSVYYYFEGKAEILTSIFRRGLEWLAVDRARHSVPDDVGTLHVLLESYARLALTWREIFRLFVHEQVLLQHIDQGSVVRAYRDVVQGGVAVLRSCRPELGAAQARALLGCAMSVVNDLAISSQGHEPRVTATALVTVAWATLDLGAPPAPVARSSETQLGAEDVLENLA